MVIGNKQKKYYEKNKEKIREKQHQYVIENIDIIRERQRKYKEKKKEEMKPIIEAKRLEKERIKAEKEAHKRPVGRPRKNITLQTDNTNKTIINEPKDIIVMRKRGRPRKY